MNDFPESNTDSYGSETKDTHLSNVYASGRNKNALLRGYEWVMDNYRYGCDRGDMRHMHVVFSAFMLPRIQYLLDHLDSSVHLPLQISESGETLGTLSLDEWRSILQCIHYSLQLDCERELPQTIRVVDLNDVSKYIEKAKAQELVYKKGLRLLGLYYSDIWG